MINNVSGDKTLNTQPFERYQNTPSARLLSDRLRLPVEQLVSAHLSASWQVIDFQDMVDFSSHPAAILTDGAYPVFVKLSEAAHGLDQFEVELAGLRLLAEYAGVLIPTPIGMVPLDGAVLMVLEAVESIERGPEQWREIGRTLARIHQVKGQRFGLDRQGYFGPLYQDNRSTSDWLTFFIERRIWPRFIGAIDSGHLPTVTIREIERIVQRIHRLDIPETDPLLLHGDAQKNNFISTRRGPLVIDPAVYYGHPEMDLAYIDYFEPVPEAVFSGYQEIQPIAPGFAQRRELWRLPGYLAAVTVEGPGHLGKLNHALEPYR